MGKSPIALQSVSHIRALRREDIATYLESVLRGGKVSEILPPDVKKENLAPEGPAPGTPNLPPSAVPVKEVGVPTGESSSPKGFEAQDQPPPSNPFQLK